ncbi:MAG TPA: hypothetical protein DCK93_09875 [Blastocatellia bacterium]|nr:hypothetical protein [Blastocatellia bacterium]
MEGTRQTEVCRTCEKPSRKVEVSTHPRSLIVQAFFENEGFGADRAEIPLKLLWEHPLLHTVDRAIIISL